MATHNPGKFREPDSSLPEYWTGERGAYASDKKFDSQMFSIGPSDCVGKKYA
jgi:hypothetical protein